MKYLNSGLNTSRKISGKSYRLYIRAIQILILFNQGTAFLSKVITNYCSYIDIPYFNSFLEIFCFMSFQLFLLEIKISKKVR